MSDTVRSTRLAVSAVLVLAGCIAARDPGPLEAIDPGTTTPVDRPRNEATLPVSAVTPMTVVAAQAARVTTPVENPVTPLPIGPLNPTTPAPGTWIAITPGAFTMGAAADGACNRSENNFEHHVTLTRRFEIAATEITQAEYLRVMGVNPAHHTACGTNCPTDMLDWHRAAAFTVALSTQSGLLPCYACDGAGSSLRCTQIREPSACAGYRLPTEAEWEFAYRAGTTTTTYAGEIEMCGSLDPTLDTISWFLYNGAGTTHPVATKAPNAFGIYDMAGNVWEWTTDGYVTDLRTTSATDPFTSHVDDLRVMRGGSYNCLPGEVRAAHRSGLPSTISGSNVGARVARSLLN